MNKILAVNKMKQFKLIAWFLFSVMGKLAGNISFLVFFHIDFCRVADENIKEVSREFDETFGDLSSINVT